MKKQRFMSLLVATALLAGFAGCSDDTDFSGNKEENPTVMANTQVRIVVGNGDAVTKANDEDGDDKETGTPDEYLVKEATLYFFNQGDGKLALDPITFTGFQKEVDVPGDKRVVWVSQNRQMAEGTYKVVVVVNGTAVTTPATGSTSIDDFLKDVKTSATTWLGTASNGLLMASRNTTTAYVDNVSITEKHTPEAPAIIETEVERTMSKITLADGQTTPNNYAYSVSGLFNGNTSTAATVTITLSNCRMLNLRNEFFTFRHTTTAFTPVNPGVNIDNVTYGFGDLTDVNSYIMDPKTFMKNISMPVGINGVTYTDWYVNNGFSTIGNAAEHILGYCQENTMEKDAQKKGYGTAIVFKGKIAVDGITIAAGQNLYYDKSNKVFYENYDALKAVFVGLSATVNYEELAQNNIVAYKDGECTYVYYIKHANNNVANDMGIMEYGMVRNNVYKVAIEGIAAPGEGLVYDPQNPTTPKNPAEPTNPTDPDPTIDPAEDIETETITVALKVRLTVKPWIVRNNNVILGQ
jgi:hypothetical protein